MMYSNKQDLGILSSVSKTIQKLSEKSESWVKLCAMLWNDKQNHPLQRWVKVNQLTATTGTNSVYNGRGICPNTLSYVEKSVADLEITRNVLLMDLNAIEDVLSDLDYPNRNELIARRDGLVECKVVIENRISSRLAQKYQLMRDAAAGCAVLPPPSATVQPLERSQMRLACPLSMAVRARWMRLEHEYFGALDEAAEITRDLAKLHSHDSSNAGDSSTGCPANASSPTVSLQTRLQRRLLQLSAQCEALQGRIVENLSRSVDLRAEEAQAQQNGSLLTWKQSYLASLVDSRRAVCTAEELREQGSIAILFGNVLESMRFVRGGLCFFDNRCFVQRMGWFEILGAEFYVPQVGCSGQVLRSAKDWGWEFVCQQGFVPTPVSGELVNSDPVFGLYRCD